MLPVHRHFMGEVTAAAISGRRRRTLLILWLVDERDVTNVWTRALWLGQVARLHKMAAGRDWKEKIKIRHTLDQSM
jgi:hypothetical protein